MKKIVRTAARLLYPFAFIYGAYIVLHGHLTPGGGFQGGAVIATGFALMLAAHGPGELSGIFKRAALNICEVAGLLIFVLAGFGGLTHGRAFLFNWLANAGGLFGHSVAHGPNPGDLNTGGLVPLLNIAVGLEVLGALSLIIYYMMTFANHIEEGGPDDAA